MKRWPLTVGEVQLDAGSSGPGLDRVDESPMLSVVLDPVTGGESLDGVAETFDVDRAAVGPSPPRIERGDGALEAGQSALRAVELDDEVVVMQVGAGVLEVREGVAVSLDMRRCLSPGPFEHCLGAIEESIGDVELPTRLSPTAATSTGETTLRIHVLLAGLVGSFRVDGQHLPLRCRHRLDDSQFVVARSR